MEPSSLPSTESDGITTSVTSETTAYSEGSTSAPNNTTAIPSNTTDRVDRTLDNVHYAYFFAILIGFGALGLIALGIAIIAAWCWRKQRSDSYSIRHRGFSNDGAFLPDHHKHGFYDDPFQPSPDDKRATSEL